MSEGLGYQITIKGGILELKTSSFNAEKGSVLHTDIFNRELAAMLSSGVIVTITGIFFVLNFKITLIHYVMAFVLFGVSFFLLRSYVFHEPFLCAAFDRGRGKVDIMIRRFFGRMNGMYNISDISDIRLGHVAMKPENPDGIKVVMNVSLQHGTVLPGFGEEEEFHTVQLRFGKRDIIIFSSKDRSETQKVLTEIRNFLEV